MAKVAYSRHACLVARRAFARRELAAAVLLGLGAADGALALSERKGPAGAGQPGPGWRIVEMRRGSPSAVLPAAQTWSVHRPAARRASAFLVIRCAENGTLSLSVSFPDRVWDGAAIVRYRLAGGTPRSARAQPGRSAAGPEPLGGSDLIRNIARADRLEVLIDDVGLGRSEAVFRTCGMRAVVERLEDACRSEERPTLAEPKGRRLPRERVGDRRVDRAPHPERREETARRPAILEEVTPPSQPDEAPSPAPAEPAPEPRQAESQATEPERDVAQGALSPPEAPAPTEPERDAAPEPSPPEAPAMPAPSEQDAEAPTQAPVGDQAAVPPSAMEPPDGRPAPPPEPSPGETADANARLAAFTRRYGPNRRRELIYGWYHQCLDRAGIDREQAWYLSGEELTYLSRGEADRVRLTMLVSTDRSLDDPPLRVTCYGTARGRELAIEQVERTD